MVLIADEVKIGTCKKSLQGGSNSRSTAYEAVALPLGHTGTEREKYVSTKKPTSRVFRARIELATFCV